MDVKANNDKNTKTAAITYEEFEPFCKWQRKEDRDVLEIHLPDFKKEQLKVQISNHGLLKISGERTLSEPASKKTRFFKEVPVSSNSYDTASIHAKFINNQLHITLPKKKTNAATLINPNEKPAEEKESKKDDDEKNPKRESSSSVRDQSTDEQQKTPKPGSIASEERNFQKRISCARLAKVVSLLVVLVLLFAYVVYMYRATVDDGQSMEWDAFDYY